MISKIISGGQTGADLGGLLAAEELGIETGGWAPKGWRTEKGTNPELGSRFALKESWAYNYQQRTKQNIIDSDGTLVFGDHTSTGSKLTVAYCIQGSKPYMVHPMKHDFFEVTAEEIRKWLVSNNIHVLNVAGNRESKNPGIQERVRLFLIQVLT